MRKKSIAEHINDGTFRIDRHGINDGNLSDIDLSFTPKELTCEKNKEGKRLWQQVTSSLTEAGMIKETDRPALVLMCQCAQQKEDLKKRLEELNTLLADCKDLEMKAKVYKQLGIQQKLIDAKSQELRLWFVQFGMTPTTRDRVIVEKKEKIDDDPISMMMKSGPEKIVK